MHVIYTLVYLADDKFHVSISIRTVVTKVTYIQNFAKQIIAGAKNITSFT